jgi:hypothetical protein
MKTIHQIVLCFIVLLFAGQKIQATDLNFGQTIYFTAPDSTSQPGTVLTSSGTTLTGFNFNNAPPTHPMFKSGIYYPVTDCQNHNLWVRMRHIAADPNGTTNGQNIPYTTNNPFYGGNNMVGGWYGFLYQFEIYKDQNFTGTRSNILGVLYPTSITVASLETLCCPEGPFEWLSFEILNPESSGWNLNSINFTGNNVNSKPGFTKTPVYVNPNVNSFRPPAFTTNFPTGSDSVYAITLTTAGGQYSEFKMSASQVSKFRYGYEYHAGGYQGMSMSFGEGPLVKDSVVDEKCYRTGGSIYLKPSGLGPYTYTWSNGQTTQDLLNAAPGTYSVTVKDGNNCVSQVSKTIAPGPVFTNELAQTLLSGDTLVVLSSTITGGVSPLSFLWNTGSTNDSLWADGNGVYILTVEDAGNCLAKDTITVSSFVGIEEALKANGFMLYPNPNKGKALLRFSENTSGILRMVDLKGREVWRKDLNGSINPVELDIQAIPAGFYTLFFESKGSSRQVRMVKE